MHEEDWMLEPRLRLGALILALPLAACASVEQRTDARGGTGFTSTTTAGAGQAAQPTRTEVSMQGYEIVPKVAVQGGPTSVDQGAARALAAGGSESGDWVFFESGGQSFAVRQVRAGGHDFAVLDPQSGPARATPELLQQVKIRTGCLTPGRTWSEDGMLAVGLDCS
jgi:hypothetical protein